ncbi:hypothetical protein CBM2637_U10022 [Cupriavidus taiwanensis]|nr:hypothetical protein CBM2637_U10022 [Cupriavidus taiwanensis]
MCVHLYPSVKQSKAPAGVDAIVWVPAILRVSHCIWPAGTPFCDIAACGGGKRTGRPIRYFPAGKPLSLALVADRRAWIGPIPGKPLAAIPAAARTVRRSAGMTGSGGNTGMACIAAGACIHTVSRERRIESLYVHKLRGYMAIQSSDAPITCHTSA